MKNKICKNCGNKYEVLPNHRKFQNWCKHDCAVEMIIKKQDKAASRKKTREQKAEKKTFKELKESLKTAGQHIKEAQVKFNAFIRLRDAEDPCISCQRHHKGQYHAGHYKTTGAHPELRFEPLNCHKQCAPCNNHLSGNILNYRKSLLKKIGHDDLEWLEGPHKPSRLSKSQLKEIKAEYTMKIREMEKSL